MWFNFVLPHLRHKYPIVFTVHDPRQHMGDRGAKKTPQWLMDFGYRQADQIIVHGSQLKQILADEIGIDPKNIHVVPHIAIGEKRAKPTESSQELDENTILFFGRIWPYKGLDVLIRAQPLISREIENAKFLICGRGEDIDHYVKMMQDPERFTIHNRWISDMERAEFFERSSIVVLPYIEATQSGVVPVAYAHCKPVVATRTGGLPDVIDDGRTGLLVKSGDEVGLANAVVRLLNDRAMQKSMGIAGNQKLMTEWAPNVVCRQTASVYRAAIEGRNTANRSADAKFSRSMVP
jgi:glycosyltransferase involved in cell wall biosynthesis